MHRSNRKAFQRQIVFLVTLLGLASASAPALHAQTTQATYPSRPIAMLAPQTAGGTDDIVKWAHSVRTSGASVD